MVKIYASVLLAGLAVLIAWVFAHTYASNTDRTSFDPEHRFGKPGRRVVAGMVGFGMAGMSAEFSPKDLSWPVALILAVAGGTAAAWYAGWAGGGEEPD